jgi:hypothetical protein
MKKLFATITLSVAASCAFGQGSVNISTGAGANTKFITASDGSRVAGADYWVQLFYANGTVTDDTTLSAAGNPVNPRTGAAAGVLPSGEIELPNVNPPGGVATIQLRAWSAVLGTTHDAAFTAWQSQAPDTARQYGRSALFQIDTVDYTIDPRPTPPALGALFPGLVVAPVPEPSAIALGLAGLVGGMMLIRRRK